MAFSDLYAESQDRPTPISTKWLKERAIRYSSITAVKEQWSGVIDPVGLRGFYLEGPIGPPIPLQANESLIVLSRAMCIGPVGEYWRRFIYTKELMHVFDTAAEKTDTPEKFDIQIDKFGDPNKEMSQQFRAEQKAFWRALLVLCPELARQRLIDDVQTGAASEEVVSARLRLPIAVIRELARADFKPITDLII